jgi:hypothetical protein
VDDCGALGACDSTGEQQILRFAQDDNFKEWDDKFKAWWMSSVVAGRQ